VAVPSYGDRLIPFCESQGLAAVRRLHQVENHFHSLDWLRVDAWISVKESELKDESVSIARKALANSRLATRIAISAIVLSIAMAVQKIIEWYSR
jgi:hypothetical protein